MRFRPVLYSKTLSQKQRKNGIKQVGGQGSWTGRTLMGRGVMGDTVCFIFIYLFLNRVSLIAWLVLDSQQSSCLSLFAAGLTSLYHHS